MANCPTTAQLTLNFLRISYILINALYATCISIGVSITFAWIYAGFAESYPCASSCNIQVCTFVNNRFTRGIANQIDTLLIANLNPRINSCELLHNFISITCRNRIIQSFFQAICWLAIIICSPQSFVIFETATRKWITWIQSTLCGAHSHIAKRSRLVSLNSVSFVNAAPNTRDQGTSD